MKFNLGAMENELQAGDLLFTTVASERPCRREIGHAAIESVTRTPKRGFPRYNVLAIDFTVSGMKRFTVRRNPISVLEGYFTTGKEAAKHLLFTTLASLTSLGLSDRKIPLSEIIEILEDAILVCKETLSPSNQTEKHNP